MKKNFQFSIFNFQFKRGFTFIETLVVISVLGLIFPIMFSILIVILQQQLKIFRLTEVKRQGDSIVSFLENIIKDNAYTIYDDVPTEICEASDINEAGDPNPFPHIGDISFFRDKYNSSFSLNYDSDSANLSISADTVLPGPTFSFPQGELNSSKVIITSFSLSCNRQSIFSAPLVSLNFTICYKINDSCLSPRPEEIATLDYHTNIKLR